MKRTTVFYGVFLLLGWSGLAWSAETKNAPSHAAPTQALNEPDVTTRVIKELATAYVHAKELPTTTCRWKTVALPSPNVITPVNVIFAHPSSTVQDLPLIGAAPRSLSATDPLFSYTISDDSQKLMVMVGLAPEGNASTTIPGVPTAPSSCTTNGNPHGLKGSKPFYSIIPTDLDVRVEHRANKWKNEAEIRLVAEQDQIDPLSEGFGTTGYTLLNLRSSYNLYKTLAVSIGVDNVYNQQNDPTSGGINFNVGMNWRLN